MIKTLHTKQLQNFIFSSTYTLNTCPAISINHFPVAYIRLTYTLGSSKKSNHRPMCRVPIEIAAPLTKIHLPIGRPNLGIPSDALTGSAASA